MGALSAAALPPATAVHARVPTCVIAVAKTWEIALVPLGTYLQAPVAVPVPTLGFTVRAGSRPSSGSCGGPAPAPVDTFVLIDSVTAQ